MSTIKTFTLQDAKSNDFVKSVNYAIANGQPDARNASIISHANNSIVFKAEQTAGEAICKEFNKIKQIGESKTGEKVSFDGRTLLIPSPRNNITLGAAISSFGYSRISIDESNGNIIVSSPTDQEIVKFYSSISRYGETISGLSDVVREIKINPVVESQSLIKLQEYNNQIMLDLRGYSNPLNVLNIVEDCFPSSSSNQVAGFPSHSIIQYPSMQGGQPVTQVVLNGDRKAFYRFLQVCEANGYNTDQAKSFIERIISSKKIEHSRADGEIDIPGGEERLNQEISLVEKNFAEHLLRTRKQAGVTIKDKQIEGIKFLITRNSAILGDEPGVGKSLQLITAAHIRLNASGGKCVIITKNIVVKQLEKEIMGMTKSTDVSSDFRSDAKWLVLPYSIFGTPKVREEVTKKLMEDAKAGKITVLILDESHTIKNGDPTDRDASGGMQHKAQNTTFNIQDIAKHVPFVWGATATMVANTADDVYNQLKAVNHPIGQLPFNRFKEKFTHPKDQAARLEKADELRQTLIDHGVYIQRTKRQVEPNLPNLNTFEEDTKISPSQIDALAQAKAGDGVKRPIHDRIAVADLKTDQSAAKAESILRQGKKVAIFTAFNSSKKLLENKLESILKRLNMRPTVFIIDGDQDSDKREAIVSSFKDPDSPVMAIVINLQAGGTGVDFPNVLTDVIINDFDWAPSTDIQSINRFFRISSKNDVNVTYMVAKGTMDENIYKRLNLKKQIADAIAVLNDQESKLIAEKKGSLDSQLRQVRERRRILMIQLAQEEKKDREEFGV